jgi:hypothetical protein
VARHGRIAAADEVGGYQAISWPIMARWLHTGTSELAAIMPLAAAAGTPMPGMQLSPHTVRPGMGVWGPGQPCKVRQDTVRGRPAGQGKHAKGRVLRPAMHQRRVEVPARIARVRSI